MTGGAVPAGRASLVLDCAVVAGRTRLVRQRPSPLLRALATFGRAEGLTGSVPDGPSPLELMLVTLGPGLLAGDRWSARVRAGPGARVRLTTQGATRVHGAADGRRTTVVLGLQAAPGSILEYWPGPTILYRRASLDQMVVLRAAPGALIIVRDLLVPGRLARGEAFQFSAYTARLVGSVGEGGPVFGDALRLGPEGLAQPTAIGRFGPWPVLGTLLVVAPGAPARALADAVATVLPPPGACLAGVTVLPGEIGLLCRLLGPTAAVVAAVLERARRALVCRASLDEVGRQGQAPAALSLAGPGAEEDQGEEEGSHQHDGGPGGHIEVVAQVEPHQTAQRPQDG